MHPGWYPDPYSNGYLRWWDGAQWTPHTAPIAGHGQDPRKDLADEQRAAGRAAPAVVAAAALGVVSAVVVATVFGRPLRDYFDEVRAYDSGDRATLPAQPGGLGWAWLAGLAGLLLTVLLMIWLYRAASLARRAGLPAKRDPVWAILGFIVPIVNFWFPYQVARDTFAPGDPRRRLAGLWWTWYLTASIGAAVVLFASTFSEAVGLVFAVADAATYLLTAAYARKLIASVGEAHEQLVRSLVR